MKLEVETPFSCPSTSGGHPQGFDIPPFPQAFPGFLSKLYNQQLMNPFPELVWPEPFTSQDVSSNIQEDALPTTKVDVKVELNEVGEARRTDVPSKVNNEGMPSVHSFTFKNKLLCL